MKSGYWFIDFFFLTKKLRSKEVISTIKLRQVVEAKVNLLRVLRIPT